MVRLGNKNSDGRTEKSVGRDQAGGRNAAPGPAGAASGGAGSAGPLRELHDEGRGRAGFPGASADCGAMDVGGYFAVFQGKALGSVPVVGSPGALDGALPVLPQARRSSFQPRRTTDHGPRTTD